MIDLIVSWGRNCDYPLWRDYIHKNRMFFDKVIVVFTESGMEENYQEFIERAMAVDQITFVNSPFVGSGQDWRNVAVNEGLKYSTSDWVYFTEQDFFPVGFMMGRVSLLRADGFDCIGVYDAGRLHPCCIFAKRFLIEKTSKDFGIEEGVSDHFGKFQREVEALTRVAKIDDNYKHFNGYSHNWRLVSEGQKPNYKPEEFIQSLEESLKVSVPLSPTWVEKAMGAIELALLK